MLRLLQDVSAPTDDVRVTIGGEHPTTGEWEASLVTAPFRAGDATIGTIGIVGPTRMDYLSAMASVKAVARRLSELATELEQNDGTIRDLYEVLGISRDASADDIKTAYRRLAREAPSGRERRPRGRGALQGDLWRLRDPLGSAEARAIRRPTASEGPPGSRSTTSRTSSICSSVRGGSGAGPVDGGRDRPRAMAKTSRCRADDLPRGGVRRSRDLDVDRLVDCDLCMGNGAHPGTAPIACRTCGGTGEVQNVRRSMFGTRDDDDHLSHM